MLHQHAAQLSDQVGQLQARALEVNYKFKSSQAVAETQLVASQNTYQVLLSLDD